MKIKAEEYRDLVVTDERYWKLLSYLSALVKERAKYVANRGYSNTLEEAMRVELDLKEFDRAFCGNLSKCAEDVFVREVRNIELLKKEEADAE